MQIKVLGLTLVIMLGFGQLVFAQEQTIVTTKNVDSSSNNVDTSSSVLATPTTQGVNSSNITSPADTSQTQDSLPNNRNDDLASPDLGDDDVEIIPIEQFIDSTNPESANTTRTGIDQNAAFSAYKYLESLQACKPGLIDAGVDAVLIKGYRNGRCHVIYSVAGRKIDCMFTHQQISQMTTPDKLKAAKEFDRGVGIMLRPIGSDDPDSPLANCIQ